MQSLCATLLRVTPSSLLRATGMGLPSAEQDGAAWRRMWLLLLLLLLQVHDGRASRAAAGRASRAGATSGRRSARSRRIKEWL